MSPARFEIYVDQSIKQNPAPRMPVVEQPRKENKRLFVNERDLFPLEGGESSIEEVNLKRWLKRQKQLIDKKRIEELTRANEELRAQVEALQRDLMTANSNSNHQQATNRLSILPQSIQPAQGPDSYSDVSVCANDAPSVVHNLWKNTIAYDKFTVPIDQSWYIRDNIPTSTPAAKRDGDKKQTFNNRRQSRPSMGGSPTLKLSPITETSRDCNSKSSSSSSAMSATPGTAKKPALQVDPAALFVEPDRPIDPNDTSTYRRLLKSLSEPLNRRPGYFLMDQNVPKIEQGVCFEAGPDSYLVDKKIPETSMYTAQLLTDDSDDSIDIPIKTVCLQVDKPPNEWLFYICNELHRRLVRQKTSPDIELSVMMTNPAVMYKDGSILIDEYSRFVSLQDLIDACIHLNKPFPKSMAAFITLELIQLVRQVHSHNIIHMNICPSNILITCCPGRDDIARVGERLSVIKLIGFDRAMDMRLLPAGFQFKHKLEDLTTCEMTDEKPWTYEVDWFGALTCIHLMFFLENMDLIKTGPKWVVDAEFNNLPTNVWAYLYDEILNIQDLEATTDKMTRASEELNTWVKANINFVLKEADGLDRILDEYRKVTKVIRV